MKRLSPLTRCLKKELTLSLAVKELKLLCLKQQSQAFLSPIHCFLKFAGVLMIENKDHLADSVDIRKFMSYDLLWQL
jgi:hypothetical protein